MATRSGAPAAGRILRAAVTEFAAHGFAGARVARIAAEARANKQLVFYYYHSKRELHGAAIHWAVEALSRFLSAVELSAPTPAGRLAQLLEAQFGFLEREPAVGALLGREAALEGSVATLAPAVSRLVAAIAEGQGRGAFSSEVDPHLLAAQALVLTLGYLQLEPVLAASAVPLGRDGVGLSELWKRALVSLVLRGAASPV